MKVSEAVASRISCRGFLDKQVAPDLIRDILNKARRAPSGGNLQPWRVDVIGGAEVKKLSDIVIAKIQSGIRGEESEYNVYPPSLKEPYRTRRFHVGEQLYALLEISRDNKTGRLAQFAENFRFFGAPVAMFFSLDREMCQGQWSDLGMFIQTIMLLAREAGLHSCAQESWSAWTPTVRQFLDIPATHIFFCGMAIGYMDEAHRANKLCTERADFNEFAIFRGFET